MSNWKSDLNAFIQETMAFVNRAKSLPQAVRASVPLAQGPTDALLPSRVARKASEKEMDSLRVNVNHSANPLASKRAIIQQRVAAFKAHQQRFNEDRQAFAELTLMRAWGGPNGVRAASEQGS